MDFKSIIKKKGLGDIFLLVALIATVCSLILYIKTGITVFNPKLSNSVIASLIAALVLEALLLAIGSKIGKYVVYLLLLYSLIEYINTQATYIANIFVAIDGSTFSAGFICTIISFILGVAGALVSGILAKDESELFAKEKTV
jgi:hypothetical protein